MIFNIYVVKDELTGRFMEPQFFRSEDEAKRNFIYQINNIKMWKDNSSDYSLYYLGQFSEDEGFLIDTIKMEKVTGGRSCVKGD